MSYSINTIKPKPCNYNCGTRIYWNTSKNAYFEVFAKKKHVCPNRTNNGNGKSVTQTTTFANKLNCYNKFAKQPKPKMSNSLEIIQGPIDLIQKKYELLSDIITEYNGKAHGSQSHILPNNTIQLILYFEVPEGKREEVNQKFKNLARNTITLNQRNN